MAKHIEVILTRDVKHLGKLGEHKSVRSGYARNYLVPQQLALYTTKDNLIRFATIKKREIERRAKEQSSWEAIAQVINGKVFEFKAKTHDEGKLYGSISSNEVHKAILDQYQITLERKHIDMPDHIREVGEYTFVLDLHPDVKASILVKVLSE